METTVKIAAPEAAAERTGPAVMALLLIYLAFDYLRFGNLWPVLGALHIPGALAAASALAWLLFGDKSVVSDRLIFWYVLFIVISGAGVLFAVNYYWAFESARVMTTYLLAGTLPLAAFLGNRRQLIGFVRFWVGIHALLGIYALLHHGKGPGAFLGDENDLALALDFVLPFAFFLGRAESETWRKVFAYGAMLLILSGIIATQSRGGFVGLVVAATASIWFSRNRLRNFVVVAIIAAAAFPLVPKEYKQQVESIVNDTAEVRYGAASDNRVELYGLADTRDATRLDRYYSWRLAVDMFLDHPILGVGAGNYPWTVARYEVRNPIGHAGPATHAGRVAHSLYFGLLSEYGTVGVIAFIAIAGGLLRRLNRLRRRCLALEETGDSPPELRLLAQGFIAGFLAFLASGAFISVFYYPHIWLFIGMVLALERAAATGGEQSELARAGETSAGATRR